MEPFNSLEDLYEDDESQYMMQMINNQQEKIYKKRLEKQAKEERKQDIKNGTYLLGSILIGVIMLIMIFNLNSKLNKQEMNSCLENNSVAYCEQNTGWGVK